MSPASRAAFDLRDRPAYRMGVVGRTASLVLLIGVLVASAFWSSLLATTMRGGGHDWREPVPDVALTAEEGEIADRMPSNTGGVPVLTYHEISSRTPAEGAGPYVTPTALFARQLAALRRAGFESVSLEQVRQFVRGRGPLPPRPVLLTFDDGHATNLAVADQVLEKYGYRGVAFIITGAVRDERRSQYYMTLDEVRRLQATGRWELGSHTHNQHFRQRLAASGEEVAVLDHPMTNADGKEESRSEWEQRVDADIAASQKWFVDNLGTSVTAFSFPYGAHGESEKTPAIRRALEATLGRHGMTMAFVGSEGDPTTAVLSGDNPFALRRVSMHTTTSPTKMLYAIEEAEPTTLPLDLDRLTWQGDQATCRYVKSGQTTADYVLTVTVKSGFGQCRPIVNPALWKDYSVAATVTGLRPGVEGVMTVRDGRTYSVPGQLQVAISSSSAVATQVGADGRPRVVGTAQLARPATQHRVLLSVTGSAARLAVDGQVVALKRLQASSPGSATWAAQGARGASVSFTGLAVSAAP